MRRALFVAVLVSSFSACGTRENAALQREVDRLRAERDKNAMIAEHLDEYKTEVARLQEDLRRTEEMGALLAHDKRVERAASVPGVVQIRTSGGAWELSGSPGVTFDAVQSQAGTLAVDQITFNATGWKIKVPDYDHQGSLDTAYAVQIPPPTPAPGRYQSTRTKRLRGEIDSLNTEIAELERLIGHVKQFETKKAELTSYLNFLDTPSRLSAQSQLASRLFLDDGAPCVSGSLTLTRESVRLFCAPRGKDHDAGASAIRALFPADGDWSIGPISIDDRAPEPLQASLTHRSSPLH